MWVRVLGMWSISDCGVVFINSATKSATVQLALKDIGLTYDFGYEVREILTHVEIGHRGIFETDNYTVPATGALMYYAYPSE